MMNMELTVLCSFGTSEKNKCYRADYLGVHLCDGFFFVIALISVCGHGPQSRVSRAPRISDRENDIDHDSNTYSSLTCHLFLRRSETDSSDEDATDEVAGNFALLRQKTGLVKLYEMMRKADDHAVIGAMSTWSSVTTEMKVKDACEPLAPLLNHKHCLFAVGKAGERARRRAGGTFSCPNERRRCLGTESARADAAAVRKHPLRYTQTLPPVNPNRRHCRHCNEPTQLNPNSTLTHFPRV